MKRIAAVTFAVVVMGAVVLVLAVPAFADTDTDLGNINWVYGSPYPATPQPASNDCYGPVTGWHDEWGVEFYGTGYDWVSCSYFQ